MFDNKSYCVFIHCHVQIDLTLIVKVSAASQQHLVDVRGSAEKTTTLN